MQNIIGENIKSIRKEKKITQKELAEKCSFHQTRTIGIVKKLDKADMIEIYKAAR